MKARRRPPRRLFSMPLRAISGVVLLVSLAGAVHFSRIVTEKLNHFAPGSEHPYDVYAAVCVVFALTGGAGMLLDLSDQKVARRWRKAGKVGRTARGKRAARSGYNSRT